MSLDLEKFYLLLLIFTRIASLLAALPIFQTNYIPKNIKLLLALAFSYFVAYYIPVNADLVSLSTFEFFLLIIKEMLLGFSIALLINIFLAAFAYAAEVISYFMGLTVANVFDPSFGQVSILSRLFILIFYALFFVTDAYQYFLHSIIQSFSIFPIDQKVLPQEAFAYILQKSGLLFILAFKLAFPFALIVYLINFSLALMNRLIPQINVFIVGLPLQIFVGIVSLMLGVTIFIYVGAGFIEELFKKYIFFIKGLG